MSVVLNRIPNFEFVDTNNVTHNIHDLLKDKVILLNLFYAKCIKKCIPIGKNLCKVNKIIGKEKLDKYNIRMISITFDPINDSTDDVNNYRKIVGADDCDNWLFLRGNPDEIYNFRRAIGMYEPDDLIDSFKQNHSGNFVLMNEKINKIKMGGGLENCLNIVNKCFGFVLPYAYSYKGGTIFNEIDYSRFSIEEKRSFFDNIITISPSHTVSNLPPDMMEIYKEECDIQSKEGYQFKPDYCDSKGNKIEFKSFSDIEKMKKSMLNLIGESSCCSSDNNNIESSCCSSDTPKIESSCCSSDTPKIESSCCSSDTPKKCNNVNCMCENCDCGESCNCGKYC